MRKINLLLFLLFQATLVFSSLPPPLSSLLSLKTALSDPTGSLHDWDPNRRFSNSASTKPSWCSWPGVTCNPNTTHVTSLDLSQKKLSGFIPPEIRFLTHLQHLNLSNNNFSGSFETAIFSLHHLKTIDISHNDFNTTFPPGISNLPSLQILNAYSNSFTGPLPLDISQLEFLEELNLGGSFFNGSVPSSYGGFQRLRFLHLAGNLLEGSIPYQLGYLHWLEHLEIGYNYYQGGIPAELGLLSNLRYLDLSQTNLTGFLPPELGNLAKLESLFLFNNQFSGEIPASLSNAVILKVLDISNSCLSGKIPSGFSSLKELTLLNLMSNNLSGEIPPELAELPNLETLLLWNNSLTGSLPPKLGSNMKLQKLDVSSNFLTGSLPQSLCYGNRLSKLIVFSNSFNSELPATLTKCTSLWRFRGEANSFSGPIPSGFGFLPNLTFLDLSTNNLSGDIPKDLCNAPRLEFFNISENPLGVTLPETIWNAPSLQIFSASSCRLQGKIPDFVGCTELYKLELEGNLLNGSIPWDIENCHKLVNLKLGRNHLTGIIPYELSTLPSISDIDLSHNSLSGTIPSSFDNCSTLESFNVSFNLLTGPVPSSGPVFKNFHSSSFAGNDELCGDFIGKPCAAVPSELALPQQPQQKKSAGALVWVMAGVFGIGIFVLIAGSRCFYTQYRNYVSGSRSFSEIREGPWKLTAFQRLNFTADAVLDCLSATDKIIGMGSTGTVYKAEMPNGEVIAIKKLWGKQKETIRRRRGVLAEVEVLGNVRHRNIVRLLGCCSNNMNTLLLYEYMPNGSLHDLLHGKKKETNLFADWLTRYKIAVGVAQGICYLHHDCDPVIVHRDLKPSNILLDGEMEARVADFGVAKLIETDEESMSVIAGSYGYIAPEYAYTLQVDKKSDIYSFGVVLMEVLSGKRSVDSEFGEGNSIVDWVRSKIKSKDGVLDVLDRNAGASCASVREEMMLVLRVALLCTSRCPADRPSMRDVVSMLQEAKPKRKMMGSDNGGSILGQKAINC